MNGCHWYTGQQGQQWTLHLLHDQFWWSGMAAQMQKMINNCEWCIQHKGTCSKAPMWPIIVTAPLELLHIDFTNIDTTMELDQPLNVVNILVFCDHFTNHVMAYVTPDQTVKTVAMFLWEGYMSIFRSPAKLQSDWGANFESNIIRELCELMGIRKYRTSPYHVQTNRHVEWAHQMLMWMIGKLSKNWKADWPRHLPKLVHVYNSTRSAITGYSPHYMMFGCQPHLPIDIYFPKIRGTKNTSVLTTTLLSYVNGCRKPLKSLTFSPHQRQKDKNGTTIGKLMPFHWNQVI